MNRRAVASVFAAIALLTGGAVAGCSASSTRSGFEQGAAGDGGPGAPAPSGDFGEQKPLPDDAAVPEIAEVFGHSAKTLYRLDPETKGVTVVGDFAGCKDVIDIALDEKSNLYAVSYEVLYTVDKSTGACTQIAQSALGSYPNSLSFVPKGTVDPNEEALVGYEGADYLRIDVKTGRREKIGTLDKTLISSGDIVSVKGGKTYLTVKGGTCRDFDCLVEVDPANGRMLKNWGSIEHQKVFGLSFWAGKIYGFDDAGNLFEVTFGTNQLATTRISIPQKPAQLQFWGAGSTTSAPLLEDPQ